MEDLLLSLMNLMNISTKGPDTDILFCVDSLCPPPPKLKPSMWMHISVYEYTEPVFILILLLTEISVMN
jgi:hypothetical protein